VSSIAAFGWVQPLHLSVLLELVDSLIESRMCSASHSSQAAQAALHAHTQEDGAFGESLAYIDVCIHNSTSGMTWHGAHSLVAPWAGTSYIQKSLPRKCLTERRQSPSISPRGSFLERPSRLLLSGCEFRSTMWGSAFTGQRTRVLWLIVSFATEVCVFRYLFRASPPLVRP
jgi:hypothetical protein